VSDGADGATKSQELFYSAIMRKRKLLSRISGPDFETKPDSNASSFHCTSRYIVGNALPWPAQAHFNRSFTFLTAGAA
jgi:hypothetical protein